MVSMAILVIRALVILLASLELLLGTWGMLFGGGRGFPVVFFWDFVVVFCLLLPGLLWGASVLCSGIRGTIVVIPLLVTCLLAVFSSTVRTFPL